MNEHVLGVLTDWFQVVALDADIQRISGLKQAKKWFQEHGRSHCKLLLLLCITIRSSGVGVIEFFDDAVKQLGLTGMYVSRVNIQTSRSRTLHRTGPGDIEFLVRADLEAIGMPALKVSAS